MPERTVPSAITTQFTVVRIFFPEGPIDTLVPYQKSTTSDGN